MRGCPLVCGVMAVAALACAYGAPAQAKPPASAGAPTPVFAPAAERLLKQVGAYLGSASAFVFHADVTFDHMLPSGQKLKFSAAEEVVLERPNGLYVEWNGDLGARQFWYDGEPVALFDPATPFYASAAAPPTIDAMLNELVPKLGFTPPLSDLLYRDPYAAVRGNIQYGFDLGQNDVNGKTCRTLAFVGKDIDWQIWIANGPQPTPCKLVITCKNGSSYLDCGGAFYSQMPRGYRVIPPPIGSTVTTLPDGAVDQNIGGTTYFTYGGAYYRPFYSGSSVIYEVVAKPA